MNCVAFVLFRLNADASRDKIEMGWLFTLLSELSDND